jgi:hypothetical protein
MHSRFPGWIVLDHTQYKVTDEDSDTVVIDRCCAVLEISLVPTIDSEDLAPPCSVLRVIS